METVNTPDATAASDAFARIAWSNGKRLLSVPLFRMMGRLRIILRVVVDVVLVIAAIHVAYWVVAEDPSDGVRWWLANGLVVFSVMGCSAAVGLYSRRLRARWRGLLLRIVFGAGAGVSVAWFFGLMVQPEHSVRVLIVIGACSAIFVGIVRSISHFFIRVDEFFQRNVLVLGGGNRASTLRVLRRRSDRRGFRLIGYVAHAGETIAVPREQLIQAHTVTSLLDYARAHNVDEIVVALDNQRDTLPTAQLMQCRLNGTEISDLSSFLERETQRIFVGGLNPGWVIFSDGFRNDLVRKAVARSLDVVVSLGMLIALWPVMVATALFIKLEDGWRAPVLYRQIRVGLFDQRFQMFKFRSMHDGAEQDGKAMWAQADDDRITRVGKLIRRVRIDELPQLFNVMRGEMSVVGPRPERPEFVAELAKVIPYYTARHSVKPGLAGWAQLCYPYGASEQDAAKKLEFDLYYAKNHNLLFDVSILLHTFETILFGRGVR